MYIIIMDTDNPVAVISDDMSLYVGQLISLVFPGHGDPKHYGHGTE
jgi:hypothetical protein